MFHIAAFYLFADLTDGEPLVRTLSDFGREHNVRGTVLVATEGVNGTIAGHLDDVEAFIDLLRSHPGLVSIEPKWATAHADPFKRLKIRFKKEIVTLGVGDVDSVEHTATHVPADEWNVLISDPDTIVVDARNDYEYAIGTFAGAVNPSTQRFGEFPEWIEDQPDIKNKKIAMFCTGGIRCEKGTAYLVEQGFTNIFQLEGGILKYLETVDEDDSLWKGECYVFDRRVSVAHGLVPGNREICPNCNTAIGDEERSDPQYRTGVHCPACVESITESRTARFAMRQSQLDTAPSELQSNSQ